MHLTRRQPHRVAHLHRRALTGRRVLLAVVRLSSFVTLKADAGASGDAVESHGRSSRRHARVEYDMQRSIAEDKNEIATPGSMRPREEGPLPRHPESLRHVAPARGRYESVYPSNAVGWGGVEGEGRGT